MTKNATKKPKRISRALLKQILILVQVRYEWDLFNQIAWKAMGMMLFDAGKIEASLKYFKEAAKRDPQDLEAKKHIGNCYYELQVLIYFKVLTIIGK